MKKIVSILLVLIVASCTEESIRQESDNSTLNVAILSLKTQKRCPLMY
jgi:hypothetical protein